RILQTGGSAFGEISTRSSPASSALVSASRADITPSISPASSIRRMRGALIWSLIRGSSGLGARVSRGASRLKGGRGPEGGRGPPGRGPGGRLPGGRGGKLRFWMDDSPVVVKGYPEG